MNEGICDKCGKELTMWAQLTVEAPARYLNRITKKAIATKEFIIWSCDWAAVTLRCHACGYSDKGLTRHIDALTQERDTLREALLIMGRLAKGCPPIEKADSCSEWTTGRACPQCRADHAIAQSKGREI